MPDNYSDILRSILIQLDQVSANAQLILNEPDKTGRHRLAYGLQGLMADVTAKVKAELDAVEDNEH